MPEDESSVPMQPKLKPSSEPSLPARAWQRMLSGRRLDLLDPSPLDIEIGDIAHGLARVARWNGQTKGAHAFSVAQHSILVEDIAGALKPGLSSKFQLAALLHDAPEYVIGDLISPFKGAMGFNYKAFEERILRAIHIRFGVPPVLPPGVTQLIKKADKIAAYHEATQLAGFSVADAKQYFGDPSLLDASLPNVLHRLDPLDTAAAQAAYLERFAILESGSLKAAAHAS
jgi:5'-deoxynucleotidase YfbR-like HD superfamily hydrolase